MVFVNQGKNMVRDYLSGTLGGSPSFMTMGSAGSPAFSAEDTAIRYEIDRTTRTFDSRNKANKEITFEMILPATEPSGIQPVTLRELIISSASPYTAGSAFGLSTFADVSKTQDVELQSLVTYRIL